MIYFLIALCSGAGYEGDDDYNDSDDETTMLITSGSRR
jgi:hypothetical protein